MQSTRKVNLYYDRSRRCWVAHYAVNPIQNAGQIVRYDGPSLFVLLNAKGRSAATLAYESAHAAIESRFGMSWRCEDTSTPITVNL